MSLTLLNNFRKPISIQKATDDAHCKEDFPHELMILGQFMQSRARNLP